jgi:hypothetical protein
MTKGWVYNPCTIFTRFKSEQDKNQDCGSKTINFGSGSDFQVNYGFGSDYQAISYPDPDPGQTKNSDPGGSGSATLIKTQFLTN